MNIQLPNMGNSKVVLPTLNINSLPGISELSSTFAIGSIQK